jgi:hypothetical protein
MEAKDPKYDLQKEVKYMRQAYQYAHSTLSLSDHSFNRTRLALLTDFEEFRLFDCFDPLPLTKNDAKLYNKYIISPFDLYYLDYEKEFNTIWEAFERNNVFNGSLSEFQVTDDQLKKNRIAPDLRFLDDLKAWRLALAKSMFKSNKDVSDEFLTTASQVMINRIIFLKMLTDREIEADYLTLILDNINNDKEEIPMYDSCREVFEELDKKYNGDIFKKREEFDHVQIENKILTNIIESLQPEKSVYSLAAMPVEIIGNAYEQFLGEVIVHKGRGLTSEQKPEVQKAGGVYYTPRYIVNYIVEITLGKILSKCKNPMDVRSIKILDPACGSGSFLIGAYDYILEWHLDYYKTEILKMIKDGKSENEIKKKFREELKYYPIVDDEIKDTFIIHLSSKLKKNILINNIHGVDIDENAVEITKFSLSMKALEDANRDELYEDVDLFNEKLLPDLNDNIKCGNSLISSDIFGLSEELSYVDKKTLNTFDWESKGSKIDNIVVGRGFPSVFENEGFDCVIGNPPYVRIQTTNANDLNYFKEKYISATKNYDIYCLFVERAIKLLKPLGHFSYILPHRFLKNDYGVGLRNFLSLGKYVKEIIDFDGFMVFTASINTCILSATKDTNKVTEYFKIKKHNESPEIVDMMIQSKSTNLYKCYTENKFDNNPWHFIDKSETDLWNSLLNIKTKLSDVTDSIFQGIKTGADTVFILDYISENEKYYIAKSKSLNRDVTLEKGIIFDLIKSGNMKPFNILKSKKLIIFPYIEGNLMPLTDLKKMYNNVYEYLIENKKILEARDGGEWKCPTWFGYSRSQALNVMWNKKILTPDYYAESCFCLDNKGQYFFTGGGAGGYGILPNNKISHLYLLGVLNSKIVNWFHQKISLRAYQTAFLYSKNYIINLPIIIPDKIKIEKVEKSVSNILLCYEHLSSNVSNNERNQLLSKVAIFRNNMNEDLFDIYNLNKKSIDILETYFTN